MISNCKSNNELKPSINTTFRLDIEGRGNRQITFTFLLHFVYMFIFFLSNVFILETRTFQDNHDFVESESMQQTLMGDPLSVLGMSLETNRCKPNQTYIWCLPFDYNQEKHPFTCELLWWKIELGQIRNYSTGNSQ